MIVEAWRANGQNKHPSILSSIVDKLRPTRQEEDQKPSWVALNPFYVFKVPLYIKCIAPKNDLKVI